MIPIEVSPEVLVALHRSARSPDESPDDVLRRLLDVSPAAAVAPSPPTGLSRPTTPPTVPSKSTTRLAGALTPQQTFRPLIIESLRRRGGEAHLSQVLEDIEAQIGHLLTEADWEVVDKQEIRWRNAVRWERKQMVAEGLIEPPIRKGYWRLSS